MNEATQEERQLRAARNQTLFRAVNEKLSELNQALSSVTETYMIACECAETTCVKTLEISMEEYLEVRSDPHRFAVLPDHVYPDIERVVAETDGYVVVEKFVGTEITEATAPGG
jgi:5-bromo-4-chloroindolyl phosphate hydrolysis protein